MTIYNNVTELIGHTPLVRLLKLEHNLDLKAHLIAKFEALNPGGSVKDRIAFQMLSDALAQGQINQSSTIIEPTSGNTGIGLAMCGTALGLKVIIVMPESMSVERRNTIKAYGAQLVLTPAAEGMKGAIAKAQQLKESIGNAYIPQQFENPSNFKAHYEHTGPEIFEQSEGQVDIFVAGVGTGGSVSGVGCYLKEHKKTVQVVAVEPASSAVLTGGKPGAHKIQGIGAGFIPLNYKADYIDEVISVSDENAISTARSTARAEGLFLGISAGAAIYAAIELAKRPENEGKNIVFIIPDSGDRYLSTALYNQ